MSTTPRKPRDYALIQPDAPLLSRTPLPEVTELFGKFGQKEFERVAREYRGDQPDWAATVPAELVEV